MSNEKVIYPSYSASALADPIDGAIALLERCDRVQLALHYNSKVTTNTRAFLAQLAEKRGMVRKGGIPDLEASARQILQGKHKNTFAIRFQGGTIELCLFTLKSN